MVILKVCRTILLVDTSVKIGLYLVAVMIGSILCDLFAFPRVPYFSDRRNFFNVYFVKLGWGWTFSTLLTFIFFTSLVYTCGKWADVRRHLMRLAVGTFWWYLCTQSFEVIDNSVGSCSRLNITNKYACHKAGKEWLGFDISGHVFLLIHCLLIISEEVKVFKDWKKLGDLLYDDELKDKRKVTDHDISQGQALFNSLSPLIKVNVVILAFLMILWELMLLISVIYRFHTLPQKVVAAFVSIMCWFVSYRILFRRKVPWIPGQPGESALCYMKLT